MIKMEVRLGEPNLIRGALKEMERFKVKEKRPTFLEEAKDHVVFCLRTVLCSA